MGLLETLMADHLHELRLRHGPMLEGLTDDAVKALRANFMAGVVACLAMLAGDSEDPPDEHVLMTFSAMVEEVRDWVEAQVGPDRDGSGRSAV